MSSIALVIFREVLEISLIITTILAATCRLTHRGRWISLGVVAGIAGSCIVAFFAEQISILAEGVGQEIFNASVLFLAALLISWTVIWMSRHGREMTQHFKEVGYDVLQGKRPLYTLSIITFLAVLREGSEIILFTFGFISSGQSSLSLLSGVLVGFAAGSAVGIALYFGLIKISARYLFSVTSWLLIFVAAGMIAESVGFLQAGNILPVFFSQVWDTSRLLSEQSFIGSILHTLIGYSSRPSAIQIASYIFTFISVSALLKLYGNKNIVKSSKVVVAVISLMAFSFTLTTNAHATKKIYSPIVEGGELEIEARGSYDFDDRASKDGKQKQKYAVGYGLTNRWFIEFYGIIEKGATDSDFEFTEVEWANRFQLTEQGQYWIDLGLYLAYEVSFEEDHADKLEGKLLLEKESGNFTHTANIIFEQQIGGDRNNDLEGGVAWSSRYRLRKYFEPGFEYHAEFGALNEGKSFDEQEHFMGPVFYGKVGKVKYDIGYLFGISDDAPEGELKWILEYEWHF